MNRIVLIHWNMEEASERERRLRNHGNKVETLSSRDIEQLKQIRNSPPEIFVVDLSRIPSQGRDVAAYFRRQKATRNVPILFLGGDDQQVDKARKLLPDATFAEWRSVRTAIGKALRRIPKAPVVPGAMAGYSGTPLPKKLGIRDNSCVLLVNPPERFDRKLEPMPEGAEVVADGALASVAVLFVKSEGELIREFRPLAKTLPQKIAFWIAWPKQASGIKTDLKEGVIREFGLAHGWVDYKICAIDETWSGLCFARRRSS